MALKLGSSLEVLRAYYAGEIDVAAISRHLFNGKVQAQCWRFFAKFNC